MSIQNLFNCPQGTSKDYWKVNCGKFGENKVVKIIIQFAEAITRGVLQKKMVLKSSSKFSGKHLCQSPFFNKVAG